MSCCKLCKQKCYRASDRFAWSCKSLKYRLCVRLLMGNLSALWEVKALDPPLRPFKDRVLMKTNQTQNLSMSPILALAISSGKRRVLNCTRTGYLVFLRVLKRHTMRQIGWCRLRSLHFGCYQGHNIKWIILRGYNNGISLAWNASSKLLAWQCERLYVRVNVTQVAKQPLGMTHWHILFP